MTVLTRQEERELKRKRAKDARTLRKYEDQMRRRPKEYAQIAEAFSLTGRKARAAAVGECVIQLTEQLRKLNREKKLLDGSLFWTIEEQRVKDPDGRKGFRYVVAWHVQSDEPYYTEEEIREEIGRTAELIRQETAEMFGEDGPGEEDLVPAFEPAAEEGGEPGEGTE